MAKDRDNDTVTLTVNGLDRKTRFLFSQAVGLDREKGENLHETEVRVLSELMMDYAARILGPADIVRMEEYFNYLAPSRKATSDVEHQSQGHDNSGSEPGL